MKINNDSQYEKAWQKFDKLKTAMGDDYYNLPLSPNMDAILVAISEYNYTNSVNLSGHKYAEKKI